MEHKHTITICYAKTGNNGSDDLVALACDDASVLTPCSRRPVIQGSYTVGNHTRINLAELPARIDFEPRAGNIYLLDEVTAKLYPNPYGLFRNSSITIWSPEMKRKMMDEHINGELIPSRGY